MRWMTSAALVVAVLVGQPSPAAADVTPDDANYIVTVTDTLPAVEGASGQDPSSVPRDDAPAQLRPCTAVSIGVPCSMVTVCEADPSMGSTHALHQYAGVLVDGWPYGVVGECEPSEAAAARPALPAVVLQEFRRVPLPEPELSIQPPKGKTLVGLETIFSTKADPFTKTLTLLGRQVTLKIKSSSFVWHHGDGTTQTTDWAGKAWDHDSPDIDGYLTHTYEHTGTVRPSVEVTWSAEFRVGGGAWQPVNGTVTRSGAPVPLQVLEGQPVLNSY